MTKLTVDIGTTDKNMYGKHRSLTFWEFFALEPHVKVLTNWSENIAILLFDKHSKWILYFDIIGCYFTRKIVHESMSKGAEPRHYVGLQTASHHHIIDITANKIISTVPTALPYCYLGSSSN